MSRQRYTRHVTELAAPSSLAAFAQVMSDVRSLDRYILLRAIVIGPQEASGADCRHTHAAASTVDPFACLQVCSVSYSRVLQLFGLSLFMMSL